MRLYRCNFSIWVSVSNPTVKCVLITHDNLHHFKILSITLSFDHYLILVLTLSPAGKVPGVLQILVLHKIIDVPCHRLIGWDFLPSVNSRNSLKLLIKHFPGSLILGKFFIKPYVLDTLLDFWSKTWKCSCFFRFPA